MTTFKAGCIQLNAGSDLGANLEEAGRRVREAAARGAQLILLPEYALLLDGSGRVMRERSPAEDAHPGLPAMQAAARETGAWILLGSLTVMLPDGRMANRSYLLSAAGEIVARYDKIHMFDVTLPGGKVIRESSAYRPGERAVVAETPWGPLGMTLCYDLRFPHLFRDLAKAGAAMVAVPSSFQRETGPSHWHTLLRARAIEDACWVFAPAMCGEHPNGRSTYGHSLVIDPWGRIAGELDDAPGVLVVDVDLDRVAKVRAMLPSLQHDRPYETPGDSARPAPGGAGDA